MNYEWNPYPQKSIIKWLKNAYLFFKCFLTIFYLIFKCFGKAGTLDFDECIMFFKVFKKSDVSPLEDTFTNEMSLKIEAKWTTNLQKSLLG